MSVTSLGIIVKGVGGLKGALAGAGYATAAMVAATGFTVFCMDAHDRSVADMKAAAERIAHMSRGDSGAFVREARHVAKASLIKYFAGREMAADVAPTSGSGMAGGARSGSLVEAEARRLKWIVEAMGKPLDVEEQAGIQRRVEAAGARVKAALNGADPSSPETRKLYALDSAIEAIDRGLAQNVSARRLAAAPDVQAAIEIDDEAATPSFPRG